MKKEFVKWFEIAKRDLDSARNSFKSKDFVWAAFQIQQSIEKGFKAVLIEKEKRLVKNHDLVYLANLVNLPEKYLNYCKEINPFYIINRYPDIPEINLTDENIEKYLFYAEEILEWCEKKI